MSDRRPHAALLFAGYLMLGALTLSPLFWASVPPLVDYPSHLARMWVLLHIGDVPALAQNYAVHWRVMPNLAMDLLVPPVARLLPLDVVGRVFIAVTMSNLVIGTMTLHRALFGRVGWWPLCSLLFVYNAVLFWGFLNFLFTLGLSLLVFSGWVASARWSLRRRVIVFALPACLIFVGHLFAFGIYGLLVASYELGKGPAQPGTWRRKAMSSLFPLVQFVPAGALWLISPHTAGQGTTAFGGWSFKVLAALAPWSFGITPGLLDGAVLLASLGFLLYAGLGGALSLAPSMRLPILTMTVVALLMPTMVNGSWGADLRLPVTLPFIAIASTQFDPSSRRRLTAAMTVLAVALLAARVGTVSAEWHVADRQFAEFRAATRSIPEGARVFAIQEDPLGLRSPMAAPTALPHAPMPGYWHMLDLAIIDRSAFVPYLLVGLTAAGPSAGTADVFPGRATPLTPAEFMEGLDPEWRPSPPDWPDPFGGMPYWRDWPQKFDFVSWIGFTAPPQPPRGADPYLESWASGSFFRIYRLHKPDNG